MIQQSVIDDILNLDVAEVIGRYITLKKKGANYTACCPFHQEKTPSFAVSPAKGIYKCFGCGKSGNSIGFVMEMKKVSFPEAVRLIASDFSIEIKEDKEKDPEAEAKMKSREELFLVNEIAVGWFQDQLKASKEAKEYVIGRWPVEIVGDFRIGYAPDGWDNLRKWAAGKKIREELLISAGLLSESKSKVFDTFRNRIIFPIMNRSGRITGFTGRDFSENEDAPKYFNTHDTEIFKKGLVLYGLNQAARAIKEKGYVHLVEGNPDVIRLHAIGKLNTVGTGGTSLTKDQVEEIAKVTNSVTIIGDSDKPGQMAVTRSGEMIISRGLFCNVITLPVEEKKHDPDSYFTDEDQFDEYAKKNVSDWIMWSVTGKVGKCKNPDLKSKLIDQISELIVKLPASSHGLYVEQLGTIVKPKKAWQDKIKSLTTEQLHAEEKENEDDGSIKIPAYISLSDFEKYGFYDDKNQYFFKSKSGVFRGSNFVMEPLFHVSSVMNAKRLYRITNFFGYSQVIELQQKDLISLAAFKLRIESLGNFLWEAGEVELNKLKRFLYEQTKTCFEITQLGWQKSGFWAWCNGIFTAGSFKDIDTNGIVVYQDAYYYIPASSNIYAAEQTLFVSERRFKFISGKVTLNDYAKQLTLVFGDAAAIGLCFYFATLFRDHIFRAFGFFPILNLFGPKGAGKTELAISLLQFFGRQTKGPNMTNSTKPALADHVALFSNSCCHLDEYKNNMEYEKIEFLKGLWDGTGRTRMNMDKDRKKETTTVDAGMILSGQEMPTADIALYSRLIFLAFYKTKYTDQERENFNYLKEVMEKQGLTHITHQLLAHRDTFTANYLENYKEASDELTNELDNAPIEDRIFRNWLIVIAAYRTLREVVHVPWTYESLLKMSADMIIQQQHETKKSNEVSVFWAIVEYLVQDGQIKEEVDFKLDLVTDLKTDMVNTEWTQPRTVLFLNHSRVFQLYRVHGNKSKENILPVKTLEYYLQHSEEYLGRKLSVSFKVQDYAGRIEEDHGEPGSIDKRGKRKVTTAICFDYDKLGISIHNVEQEVQGLVPADEPF